MNNINNECLILGLASDFGLHNDWGSIPVKEQVKYLDNLILMKLNA